MAVERFTQTYEYYRITLEKTISGYTYKFVCDLSPYRHWCTALQMSNFSLTFFKPHPNPELGIMSIKVSEAPEWLVKAAQKALISELDKVARVTLGKKYINSSVHLSEYEGAYSHIYSVNEKVIMNHIIFDPIMAEDLCTRYEDTARDNSQGFCHVGIRVADLQRIHLAIQYTAPGEDTPEPKSGITLKQLREYLDNV